ncbi:GMC family oxidoreductase [Simiduia agarivorans]|uniref:Alcohol/choline dehydrogenase n=1 Tax=Simiduia agarivorans (strain DSM 21679 / JCM 13881 / BCRC 17597 / SA1) TaxID=1117647 RepID=K4KME9_SIMAS|nr:choline dehydrogenase [Simiduia agarivorans]AFU99410.1 alcohol/choline dehydrogenase [Simiduia agarivorans SA1 = DSM 21679]
MTKRFDYVIVGAGSAGCVLANRLSADPDVQVCLIEAGGSDRNPLVYTPMGVIAALAGGLFNWKFNTPPQPTMGNREIYCPRGKTLGGSSSINAMLYVRGQAEDYDAWAAAGNAGWSFQDVLPYFRKAQNQERGENQWHGVGGPLNVAEIRNHHPLCQAFIDAGAEMGYPRNDDFNGASQEGFGWYQTTQKNGQRHSAAAAYLHPVLAERRNLTVMTHTRTHKILFEGKRAVGVEVEHDGSLYTIHADREVILSGGAFGSPQLLLLSGVGPADKLAAHGISQVHELPGVGENLQEHVDVLVVAKDKTATSWGVLRPLQMLRNVRDLFRYIFRRDGMLSSTIAEAGAFIKSDDSVPTPDLQLHITPLAMDDHGRNPAYYFKYGMSVHVCYLRPHSRGSVALNSGNPADDPRIDLNLLSDPRDTRAMVKGVKILRDLFRAQSLDFSFDGEIDPGDKLNSDAEIETFLRMKANHVYHPVGTCKMGSDAMAVVDAELKVHGLDNLRVVDASIMPTLISGNTNAPTIMIAEKAADMILQSGATAAIESAA